MLVRNFGCGDSKKTSNPTVLEILSRSLQVHPDPIDSGNSAKTEILKKKEALAPDFRLADFGIGEGIATL